MHPNYKLKTNYKLIIIPVITGQLINKQTNSIYHMVNEIDIVDT